MPYHLDGNCVKKESGETVPGGCHETHAEAARHLRALEANVKDSNVVEMSLTITKASYEKGEKDPNKKRRILMTSSDTSPDLATERMSSELFRDFTDRIENNAPVPDVFRSVVCEDGVWCGGMPYISIAHYKAGTDAKNVPGTIESVYVDGKQLKSKAYLHDTPLGRALFDSICDDHAMREKGKPKENPVRVSIMFLDLEHVHEVEGKTITFTRTGLGQICDLCEKGAGGKIYKKGILVHEAATRYPMNQRTDMSLEEKSMSDNVITKKDDAASIIGDELAEQLEQKSLASDILVTKAEPETPPDTQKELEELRAVKSETIQLRDEVKALYEKLQAEKSVPVEDTKMETVVEEKAKGKDEEEMDEEHKKMEKEHMKKSEPSAIDVAYEALKSVLASAKNGDEVQAAFNALGVEVQKAFTPPAAEVAPAGFDAAQLKSIIAEVIAPLQMEITQLKAATAAPVQRSVIPASRALKPADLLLAKSASQDPQQPVRQFSQIEKLARKSVDPSLPI